MSILLREINNKILLYIQKKEKKIHFNNFACVKIFLSFKKKYLLLESLKHFIRL